MILEKTKKLAEISAIGRKKLPLEERNPSPVFRLHHFCFPNP